MHRRSHGRGDAPGRVPADRVRGHARTLHVAALPFPTRQGTQAAIAAMLRTLVRADREAALLTYGTGRAEAAPPFPVHRGPSWLPETSLRSGPSVRKLLADLALARELPRVRARAAADVVIAHHVEGALVASRQRPRVFFAHTDLRAELPSYGPAWLRGALALAGGELDRALAGSAGAVATVSPLLHARMAALAGEHGPPVRYVPLPWSVPPPIERDERSAARARLGLPAGTAVIVYAGNLDRYQGWEALVGAVSQLNRGEGGPLLLVATASDSGPLWREARRAGVASRVRVVSLVPGAASDAGESVRRAVHAAADVVAVPRREAGGVPIKLLDALGRGAACAIAASAVAGLPLAGAACVARGDDAPALADALSRVLCAPAYRASLAHLGRAYVAAEHDAAAFLRAFDAVCAAAEGQKRLPSPSAGRSAKPARVAG